MLLDIAIPSPSGIAWSFGDDHGEAVYWMRNGVGAGRG